MPSNNSLINGPDRVEVESIEITRHEKPFRSWAYRKSTGESKLFESRQSYLDAMSSGIWVDSPTKTDAYKDQITQEIYSSVGIGVAPRKFVSQMNVAELIEEGLRYGLNFSDGSKTKNEMRKLITRAKI